MVSRINNTSNSSSSHHRRQPNRKRGNNNNKRKAARVVRFAPESRLCDYHPKCLKELTDEMCQNIWVQPKEFEALQSEIRMTSSSAVRKGLSAYVSRTYGYNDEKTQDMYNLWARCSDTRRGLERFVNEEYGRTRKQIQQKTVQAVLYTQDRLRNDKECHDDYSRSSQVISNVSTRITADAITFAAMLGKADHAAVMNRRQRPQKPVVTPGSAPTIVRRIPSINRRNSTTNPGSTKLNNNTIGGRSSTPSKFSSAARRSASPSKFASQRQKQESKQEEQQQQQPRPLVRRKPVMLQHYKPVVFQPYSSLSTKKEINEDDSENSDTVPIVRLSPEQQRAKKEKRDQQQLLEHANFGRSGTNFGRKRDISWVPRR